jgi:hypothetical protein
MVKSRTMLSPITNLSEVSMITTNLEMAVRVSMLVGLPNRSGSSFKMAAQSNGFAVPHDWPGRYYHIDQILDAHGPRTEPAFLAGDEV